MSRISRQILIGALILIFSTSACGRLTLGSPTPVWTVPPSGQPILPTTTILAVTPTTSTNMTVTPLIPLTGENVVSMQCQFCVDEEAHAILIFPDFAYFDVGADPSVSCLTADVAGGKRILICHGAQSTTFNLNVCADPANCLEFPVALQPCPLLQADATPLATGTPFYLTPINTLQAPTRTKKPTNPANTAVPSTTPSPGGAPATSTPGASTPTLTISTPTTAPQSTATSPTSYSSGSTANTGP